MKNLTNKTINKIIVGLIITSILLLIYSMYSYNTRIDIYKAKIDLLNHKVNTPSDIEKLEAGAKDSAVKSNTILTNINSLKKTITNLEKEYEYNILSNRCYLSQISRKIDGLEYNVTYCKLSENLLQFKTKKDLRLK